MLTGYGSIKYTDCGSWWIHDNWYQSILPGQPNTTGMRSSQAHMGFNQMARNNNRNVKGDFPRFDGLFPRTWLWRCNRYFGINLESEEDKVYIAAIHLDGIAHDWYSDNIEGWEWIGWEAFSNMVLERFVEEKQVVVGQLLNEKACDDELSAKGAAAVEGHKLFDEMTEPESNSETLTNREEEYLVVDNVDLNGDEDGTEKFDEPDVDKQFRNNLVKDELPFVESVFREGVLAENNIEIVEYKVFDKMMKPKFDSENFTLRKEDFISDQELGLVELRRNCWDIKFVCWPCSLLCNKMLIAMSQAKELDDAINQWVWSCMCKVEYRGCAVTEVYDNIKYLLLQIIRYDTEKYSVATEFFIEVDDYLWFEKFTGNYKTSFLSKIHGQLISLIELLLLPEQKDMMDRMVNVINALYELAIRELSKVKKHVAQLRPEPLAALNLNIDVGLLLEDVVHLPDAEDAFFFRQLRCLCTVLNSRDSMHSVQKSIKARRRVAFFSNPLLLNMPHEPRMEKMMALSVLTHFYDKEVLFRKRMLRRLNEDWFSILFYLHKIYADEWANFTERMSREGMQNENQRWSMKIRELRLWDSYRGRTLSRTVTLTMYYYKALKMFSLLSAVLEMDIRQDSQEDNFSLASLRINGGGVNISATNSQNLNKALSSVSLLYKAFGASLMKYTYMVSWQMYGAHEGKCDHRVDEILYLVKNNEALRVAYVEDFILGREEVEHYSVSVKYNQQLKKEVKIYRIKLPGPFKLGEGKPETQNHRIMFTCGDALQTSDMNQGNYFEAIKVRNLLQEFEVNNGIKKIFENENIGLAVLRSSIREFLCSEAMNNLGIPKTWLVTTDTYVTRDMFYDGNPKDEPGAIFYQVSQSFLCFGSVQMHASRGRDDFGLVRTLVHYATQYHFSHFFHLENLSKNMSLPSIGEGDESVVDLISSKYATWVVEVTECTTSLVAKWQVVGFTRRALNADNYLSVVGLTIDYGPFCFLDAFDPSYNSNTNELPGRRYCLANQPDSGLWKNSYFATNISAAQLMNDEEANYAIERYETKFMNEYQAICPNLWEDLSHWVIEIGGPGAQESYWLVDRAVADGDNIYLTRRRPPPEPPTETYEFLYMYYMTKLKVCCSLEDKAFIRGEVCNEANWRGKVTTSFEEKRVLIVTGFLCKERFLTIGLGLEIVINRRIGQY